MDKEKKIFLSVMIPVYNKSEYLDMCLNSIVTDKMDDLEIIVVDDGSTDDSYSKLTEWCKKDSRIRVFHQENGGVASARSYALSKAKGEYIINCDPDDWVEPGTYSQLKLVAQKTDADVIIFDIIRNCSDGTETANRLYIDCSPSAHCRSTFISLLKSRNYSTCNKMIRRKIVEDNQIDYLQGIDVGEDFLFIAKVFLALPKNSVCAKIDKALYHYRETPGFNSLTQKVTYKSLLGHEEIIKWRLKNMDIPELSHYNRRALFHFCYLMLRCDNCPDEYAKSYAKQYLHYGIFIESKICTKWIIALMLKLLGYSFTRKCFSFIKKILN
ncbi:MAG: glycosyltransferase [Bacteroides sp.]|nr:glycosyltransferase [Bacteroides sp.]MCM1456397.1 glycosyltransferase [Lachnoclostridium sp.]